jgi:hypothetical protein
VKSKNEDSKTEAMYFPKPGQESSVAGIEDIEIDEDRYMSLCLKFKYLGTYLMCFGKSCDVPLKPYFWLVTFQLVLLKKATSVAFIAAPNASIIINAETTQPNTVNVCVCDAITTALPGTTSCRASRGVLLCSTSSRAAPF